MDTSKLTNEDLYFDFSLFDNIKKFEKIYNIIYNKAKNGESLTEIEKEFLCRRLKIIDIDKLPFDSNAICKNHRFKFIYLVYMWDLSGGSVYTKPFKLKMVTVPIPEAQEDLKYLMDQADNWENILNDPNLTDQLLIQSKREVDIALKGIKMIHFILQVVI